MYYHNVGGMRTKIKFLKDNIFTLTQVPDIIVLTETWLISGVHKESEFELPKYKIAMGNRDYLRLGLTCGGGVLIATRTSLNPKPIEITKENPYFEIAAVEFVAGGRKFVICAIYIPPSYQGTPTPSSVYLAMTAVIGNIAAVYSDREFIVAGDFNLNHMRRPLADWISRCRIV